MLAARRPPAARPKRRGVPRRAFFGRLFGGGEQQPAAAPAAAEEEEEVDEAVAPLPGDTREAAALRVGVLGGSRLASSPLELAYDASRDGWRAAAFHDAVDGRGPAVLVGVTKLGAVFGAYNGVGWDSVEDYRDTNDAWLFCAEGAELRDVELLEKVGPPALFDYAAQGPTFGADSLKIPLGSAPSMGSSYAVVGGGSKALNDAGSQEATSRLGSYFARRASGARSVFTTEEKGKATLTELRVYVAADQ